MNSTRSTLLILKISKELFLTWLTIWYSERDQTLMTALTNLMLSSALMKRECCGAKHREKLDTTARMRIMLKKLMRTVMLKMLIRNPSISRIG